MKGVKCDLSLMERIAALTLSERAKRLKAEFLNCTPHVSSERSSVAMQSWRETEGEPLTLRRAKLVESVLKSVPIEIFPDQLLVGRETAHFRGAYPHVDFDGAYLEPLLTEDKGKVTMGGPVEKAAVAETDLEALGEAVRFWRGRTAADMARKAVRESVGDWYDELVAAGISDIRGWPWAPAALDYEAVLGKGLKAIVQEAEARLAAWRENGDDDVEKVYFWQAVMVVCEATIEYAKRYAERARELAADEEDEQRRGELTEVAEACTWVPENPARTLKEALQSLIIVHLAAKLESPLLCPASWGLPDQYLLLYFKQDLRDQRLTVAEAADLLHEFLLYSASLEFVVEMSWRDHQQKGMLTNMALGGTKPSGEDASNELSYFFLHVAGLVGYPEPHITLRWTRATPDWLMLKAIETNRRVGGGIPQFQNSEHIVDYLVERGVSLEDARNWKAQGCSQALPGDQGGYPMPGYINVPLCLDLALHNGVFAKTGRRLGIETGDPRPFKTFDEFYDAFKKQTEFVIRRQIRCERIADREKGRYFRQPLASALMSGCVQNGADYALGGLPHYRISLKKDRGIIPTADSLLAVKQLVYDEKKLTMDELLEALGTNFAGSKGEKIRQMCLRVPKYGNDIDVIDDLVRELAKFTGDVIQSEKNIFGYPYAVNRNGQSWHFDAGKKLAALPNGRKEGEPLADGSLSSTQGMDREGLTALLNSALTADFAQSSEVGILNVKIPAQLVRTPELQGKIVSLTQSFLSRGGTHIQYNILDAATLREAQVNPEKYRDLLVRVGGYSAYFVFLSREVQDEIIRRTEHGG